MPSAPAPADAADLVADVLAWYELAARDLPWRRPGTSPYEVLVSEVMLQQTPVARVLPAYEAWLARWPRVGDVAAAPAGEVIRQWGGLGYPRRALRLHAAAVACVRDHAGRVPADHAALLALPGVGEYTAAAVAVWAFGATLPVLDTNVRRVLARVVVGRAAPPPAVTAAERALAASLLPPRAAGAWSVAVMELGALVCTARAPRCGACPLSTRCAWRAAGFPPRTDAGRRPAPWSGTDRQCRGRLLAAVREASAPVTGAALVDAWPADAEQRERALTGLLGDGLLVAVPPPPAGTGDAGPVGYALPG